MAAVTQMRQESLQKSILFMQQEHANTLKALHEEIHKLQKKCSELTFQLAMETTSSPQEDLLKERTEQLETELATCKQQLADKLQELVTKDKLVDDLKLRLKAQEKGYRDKVTHLNQLVVQYKRQAEESAAQNADLLLQSHRENAIRLNSDQPTGARPGSKQQIYQKFLESQVPNTSSSSSHVSTSRSRSTPKIKSEMIPHAPEEPIDGRPPSSGKPRHRVRAAMMGVPDPALRNPDLIQTRSASGRRLLAQDDCVVPDPKPFLKLSRERSQTVEVPKPRDPLPPINRSAGLTGSPRDSNASERRSSVPGPSKTESANFKKLKERKKRSSPGVEVEMETLALEDITKRSVSSLRKAQEYGSD